VLARLEKPVRVRGRNTSPRPHFASAKRLVDEHFIKRSTPDHVNRTSILDAIELLGERPSLILETGSSAWGTNSSRLFDDYVGMFGGEFTTVDIRIAPLLRLWRDLGPRSSIVCDDSVRFLRRWVAENPGRRADLVYLDSYDLDLSSPTAAAVHALLEFDAIRPALREGSLLLIDDTPVSMDFFAEPARTEAQRFKERSGLIPGKGMLVDVYLGNDPTVTKVHHRYQTLYRFGTVL
jgi:hypothetical protein